MPTPDALDLNNVKLAPGALEKLLEVDIEGWSAEIPLIKEHYEKFDDRLPQGLRDELKALEERLVKAKG